MTNVLMPHGLVCTPVHCINSFTATLWLNLKHFRYWPNTWKWGCGSIQHKAKQPNITTYGSHSVDVTHVLLIL